MATVPKRAHQQTCMRPSKAQGSSLKNPVMRIHRDRAPISRVNSQGLARGRTMTMMQPSEPQATATMTDLQR
eukprot:4737078-Pleurochrysis_carterae.AAC.1